MTLCDTARGGGGGRRANIKRGEGRQGAHAPARRRHDPPPRPKTYDKTGRRPRAKPYALPPESGGASGPARHRPAGGRTKGWRRQQAARPRRGEGEARSARAPSRGGKARSAVGRVRDSSQKAARRGETCEHVCARREANTTHNRYSSDARKFPPVMQLLPMCLFKTSAMPLSKCRLAICPCGRRRMIPRPKEVRFTTARLLQGRAGVDAQHLSKILIFLLCRRHRHRPKW